MPANRKAAKFVRPAMTQRAATTLAIALAVFCAASATVAADVEHGAPSIATVPTTNTPGARGEAARVFSVYPGPVPFALVEKAVAFWNSAGADVRLTIATSKTDANVVITPYEPLTSTEEGVTDMPCQAPCKPNAPETITLSTNHPNEELVLAHEIGHSIGLAHTHVTACSVMAPVVAEHCATGNLPDAVPAPDREEILSIWGPAPTTATTTNPRSEA